jgi:hypothetical protein
MMENAACQLDFNAHKILIRPLAESDLPALEWGWGICPLSQCLCSKFPQHAKWEFTYLGR